MTFSVAWNSPAGGNCTVTVELASEAFLYTKRDFLTAMDDVVTEVEDVLCKEYENRTGKKL